MSFSKMYLYYTRVQWACSKGTYITLEFNELFPKMYSYHCCYLRKYLTYTRDSSKRNYQKQVTKIPFNYQKGTYSAHAYLRLFKKVPM